MGGFCLPVELHWEGSAPAACATCLFLCTIPFPACIPFTHKGCSSKILNYLHKRFTWYFVNVGFSLLMEPSIKAYLLSTIIQKFFQPQGQKRLENTATTYISKDQKKVRLNTHAKFKNKKYADLCYPYLSLVHSY